MSNITTNNHALLGCSGFVGNTLSNQHNFEYYYRSNNIDSITGKEFELVVCAAAPGKKWKANLYPLEDLENIKSLINRLDKISTTIFILISTIDVFSKPNNINENTEIEMTNLQPYGYNRRQLELYVQDNFEKHLIIRLPALVGKGLRKNVLFDLLNNNQIEKIDSRNIFQFYPMINLWKDINLALEENINLVHFSSEPISVNEICSICLGIDFKNYVSDDLMAYDFKSIHSKKMRGKCDYHYSKSEVLNSIKEYFRNEQ